MGDKSQDEEVSEAAGAEFYCVECRKEVGKPLVCGDCGAVICRDCGKPLERVDELGIG
ncbi:MAG TPA: hypothetical protein VJ323_06650 [Bryobacteraceae bacterium]|jgi:hypothetical protein|nr:hypothetical protein [Bryobacteraceae bacterium]